MQCGRCITLLVAQNSENGVLACLILRNAIKPWAILAHVLAPRLNIVLLRIRQGQPFSLFQAIRSTTNHHAAFGKVSGFVCYF
jgi:hypothetical protein